MSCASLRTIAASSSSVMLTVDWWGAPSLTPSGRGVSKETMTLSSSSSTSSWVALNVNVCSVSSLAKVTFAGTPE